MARIDGATVLLARPTRGRTFTTTRRVRLSDTDADGVLRLDALARYAQDIASDDAREALPGTHLAWVVRRTMLEIHHHLGAEEELELTTWCSGFGSRWAERRTSVVGAAGGAVEMVVLWVAIDTAKGTPARLDGRFADAYSEAAAGRQVAARLQHHDAPEAADQQGWIFRATDVDRLGHVNNAAYWSIAEEVFLASGRPQAIQAELEYRSPVDVATPLVLKSSGSSDRWQAWLTTDGDTHASLTIAAGGSTSAREAR